MRLRNNPDRNKIIKHRLRLYPTRQHQYQTAYRQLLRRLCLPSETRHHLSQRYQIQATGRLWTEARQCRRHADRNKGLQSR